ncbi:MAG: ISAs1 family transposase [Saccharospirillaceae bacterium]|nr:ISAs1 family transposase [Saccharospirillaceae bacterium]
MASLSNLLEGEVVAIDGKTIRGAKVNGVSPIHMVSAWACESNLVLDQQKEGDKTNEISAIPNLIEALALEGTTVTIDAMGCQTGIAQNIIDAQANYVLAVKANQPELLENIEDEFRFNKDIETSIDIDYGHGRIETRTCSVINNFIHIEQPEKWVDLKYVVRIQSIREFKATGKIESATRYYITSLKQNAKKLQQTIRSHWAIENKLHWSLDVAFNEDLNRKGNAFQNFSLINKIALNPAKKEKTCKKGIKSKRKKAGWDNQYLEILLKV